MKIKFNEKDEKGNRFYTNIECLPIPKKLKGEHEIHRVDRHIFIKNLTTGKVFYNKPNANDNESARLGNNLNSVRMALVLFKLGVMSIRSLHRYMRFVVENVGGGYNYRISETEETLKQLGRESLSDNEKLSIIHQNGGTKLPDRLAKLIDENECLQYDGYSKSNFNIEF